MKMDCRRRRPSPDRRRTLCWRGSAGRRGARRRRRRASSAPRASRCCCRCRRPPCAASTPTPRAASPPAQQVLTLLPTQAPPPLHKAELMQLPSSALQALLTAEENSMWPMLYFLGHIESSGVRASRTASVEVRAGQVGRMYLEALAVGPCQEGSQGAEDGHAGRVMRGVVAVWLLGGRELVMRCAHLRPIIATLSMTLSHTPAHSIANSAPCLDARIWLFATEGCSTSGDPHPGGEVAEGAFFGAGGGRATHVLPQRRGRRGEVAAAGRRRRRGVLAGRGLRLCDLPRQPPQLQKQ